METKDRSIEKIYDEYIEEIIKDGVEQPSVRTAMDRSIDSYRKNTARGLVTYPATRDLAKKIQEVKNYSIDHLEELLKQTMESVERNHGHAYFAKDGAEANKIIAELVGEPKQTIVKAKSLTSEEIHLREYLEEVGHEVYETDLGEFLLQLRKTRPMHLLSPSIDLSREEAAKLVGNFLKKDIPPDIKKIVDEVRHFLRQKFFDADVGISGANSIAADTGAVFIVENEGNARLSIATPRKHIVIVGVEKIVPTLYDAFQSAEIAWRYGNYPVPAYVNMVTGPSKTGDIEKVTTYGAHGPEEFHVVFLDNGRMKMAKDPVMKEALRCLRCGGCLYECPVYAVTAGHFGKQYLGGIGIPWDAYVALNEKESSPEVYTCTLCDRCTVRCPMEIPVPNMVRELRHRLVEKGQESPRARAEAIDVLSNFFGEDYILVKELKAKKEEP